MKSLNNQQNVDTIVLLDGNSILYRMYFGTIAGNKQTLRTSNNTATNAISAFVRFLFKNVLFKFTNFNFVVAFDGKEKTWRHKLYTSYKQGRNKTPPDLHIQKEITLEFLKSINAPYLIGKTEEADDIIASLAKKANDLNKDVFIITSDRDLLQLVNKKTTIYLLKNISSHIEITNNNFYDNYKLFPQQIIDYKALAGDSSDNIPGVEGIGDKTAKLLLGSNNTTVEEIFENWDFLPKNQQKKLINQRNNVLKWKKLVTLRNDIEYDINLTKLFYLNNFQVLSKFFKKYEMIQLARQYLPKEYLQTKSSVFENKFFEVQEILSFEKLDKTKKWIIYLQKYGKKLNKFETNGLYFCELEQFSDLNKTKAYFCTKENLIKHNWKKFFENKKIQKFFFNAIEVLRYMFINEKVILNNFDDLHVAYYCLNSTMSLNLPEIHRNYALDICEIYNYKEIYETLPLTKDELNHPWPLLFAYTCYKALLKLDTLWKLVKFQPAQKHYQDLEIPLINIIRKIEQAGVCIDKESLLGYQKEILERLNELTKQIYDFAEYEFNINSTLQLKQLLYEKLNIKLYATDKKNTTDSRALMKVQNQHPIISCILEYRKYKKLDSTYIKGFLNFVEEKTSAIYPVYNQTSVATGRLSCRNPNLQNIVTKNSSQNPMRKHLVARKNHYLFSVDYDQIELRILAHYANFDFMINKLNQRLDFHDLTAQKLFNNYDVSDAQRSIAKTLNYSVIYGITAFGISQQLNIPQYQARDLLKEYKTIYEPIFLFKEKFLEQCQTKMQILTLKNFLRNVEEITRNNNKIIRRDWERVSFNFLIQGSAADVIKLAMIKLNQYFVENNLNIKIITQIHDELIFEVHESIKDEKILQKIISIMKNIVKLKVKLYVHSAIGKNWYDLKLA